MLKCYNDGKYNDEKCACECPHPVEKVCGGPNYEYDEICGCQCKDPVVPCNNLQYFEKRLEYC